MRIGELAARSGLSTKAIRYYEDAGLLWPPPRTPAGYRDYDQEATKRLGFIRAAQSIGLSLGEIREVLAFRDRDEAPCAYVTGLIERHAAELADRIEVLRQLQTDLTNLALQARSHQSPDTDGDCYCHIIEDRQPRRGPEASRPGTGLPRRLREVRTAES
jgi:MerR family copper efflux transcriptional regulator